MDTQFDQEANELSRETTVALRNPSCETEFYIDGSASSVADVVLGLQLVSREQWDAVLAESTGTAQSALAICVSNGLLTPFQAAMIAAGNSALLRLGQYLLLDEIGAGGMGRVYRAKHTPMDRVVALKILSKELVSTTDAVARFQREMRAAARLIHSRIVTAFDAGCDGDTHFLVMEYVDGTNLHQIVKEHGPLDVADAVGCVRQIAEGLAFAHERGVVHRDIKASNEDGILSLDGGAGWLGTQEHFSDFELEFEYRLPERGNSGIFLRADPQSPSPGGAYHLEVQLLDDKRYVGTGWPTASLHGLTKPDSAVDSTPDTWHSVRIIAEGIRVRVWHNDSLVLDAKIEGEKAKRQSGQIGLQVLNTPAQFRSIRIRELQGPDLVEHSSTPDPATANVTQPLRRDGNLEVVRVIEDGDRRRGVSRVVFTSDGQQILAAGADAVVRRWDVETGKLSLQFESGQVGFGIASFALSPDERYVATGHYRGRLQLLDAKSGMLIKKFDREPAASQTVSDVAFSPDGRFAAAGSLDATIRIFRLPADDSSE
ncbi:MAG: DUF1080 domain-containing protein [Planctomycetota bacterium]|nr:DUF1080 domain-containing protein [Planctomycetota bacterium]